MRVVFLDTEYDPQTLRLLQLSYIVVDGRTRFARNFYFRASDVPSRVKALTGLAPDFLCRAGTEILAFEPAMESVSCLFPS